MNPVTSQLPDIDPFAKIMEIRHIRRKGPKDIPQLIEYLTDPSPAVANAARESLFALRPMASLTERWTDDSVLNNRHRSEIPTWLWNLCQGWGAPGDFIDLCIKKACSLKAEEHKRFLNQLATFQGLERQFINRLEQRNLSAMAVSFKTEVQLLRGKQFPKQLTLSPTLACQLSCNYCVSAGAQTGQKNEMSFSVVLKILGWAQRNGIERIALTGGEPTLYSHLFRLLDKISKNGFQFYLATNGLGSRKAMRALADARPLCVTMHLTPQVLISESLKTYIRNAAYLIGEDIYAVMRCNFPDPKDDVIPYFDIAEQAGLREIRTAIPIPNAKRRNQYVDRSSLNHFGKLLSTFVVEGKQRGIVTKLAKPFFPCKLSFETAQVFFSNGSMSINCPVHYLDFSNNLTVYPDGSFIPCLGVSINSGRDIMDFSGPRDAARIFKDQLSKIMKVPMLESCQECPLWIGGRCVGACLSYRLPLH
jgi:MoaA/NifB/PqqE/SkfB family radical SAM enzyme